jgi:hypothetical protein
MKYRTQEPDLIMSTSLLLYFHPSKLFGGKSERHPLEFRDVRGSTLVSSGLACKYWTRVEVANTIA